MNKYDFLQKARNAHGFKYSYLNLNDIIKSNDIIDVVFDDILYKQRVVKHLMGRCPEKNTPIKTTENFLKEAHSIWGDKYDYSLVKYEGAHKKIKIIYDGIVFEQTSSSHLQGQSVESNMNLEYFIKKSKDKWKDKYDYSLVKFKNCNEKVEIIFNGIVYEQTPSNHLIYAPERKKDKVDTLEFIKRSNKVHNSKYDYSKTNYTYSSEKVIIICTEHGEFLQVANSHLRGMGCKKCGDKYRDRIYIPKYSTEEFIMDAKLKWGDKYDYSLTEYKNSKTKVKILHDGIVYEQLPKSHLKYPVEGFLNQEIFLIKSKRKWDDKYDYSLSNFISCKFPIKIIYNNKIYEQLPHNHLIYAPELRNSLTLEEFIEQSNKIHNNKYNYEKSFYVNSLIKITIKCPLHGYFHQLPGSHLSGSGCRMCSDSKGEREISKFLEKYKISYTREHIFPDCRNKSYLKFDFYIESLRTCIEFDGIQHFQPISFFGGVEAFEKYKINDEIKNNYCEENFINLIRIKYDQDNIIWELLWNNLKSFINI